MSRSPSQSPAPQTAPMTPSSYLQTTPLSPTSPYPATHLEPESDNTVSGSHLEELNRYGRQQRREDEPKAAATGYPVSAAILGLNDREGAQNTTKALATKGSDRHVNFGGDAGRSTPASTAPSSTAAAVDLKQSRGHVEKPQPGAERKVEQALKASGQGEWHRGLFSCFESDGSDCMTTTFCPCVTFSEIRYRTKRPEDQNLAEYNKFCNVICWGWSCLACYSGLGAALWNGFQRNQLRHRLGIRGNGCEDCMTGAFCGYCQLCQELDHVKHDHELPIKKNEAEAQASSTYDTQPQMSYTAQ